MNNYLKGFLPHFLILLGFVVISMLYFYPLLQGKRIYQNDIAQYKGMAQQQIEFREQTGKETFWTNSAFGGMPTYQLGAQYDHYYIKKLDRLLRFLPRPADYVFLYFVCFYILLLSLKLDYRLAGLGALAFGLSTYLIIILGVGHNAKAHAIAYMPLVLSGIILTFRKKYILGFILTAIALSLELSANHYQMTYYLMLLVIVLGLVYLVDSYKKKMLPHFFKSVLILIPAVVIAVGMNASVILSTQEYVKESTRSKSELTINSDGSPRELSDGLSREYITQYSYGISESLNLFIPRFMGGGSYEDVGKESNTYNAFRKLGASPVQALQESRNAPTYWGEQPIVEAPAYIGAVVIFLFLIGIVLVKGRLKWWLIGGTLLSLLLSYGKNLGFLTDLFIDFVPLYDKFRAVSSIQVILELCIPVLGIFGLYRFLNDAESFENKMKALKIAAGITVGVALIILLFNGSLFEFKGMNDAAFENAYGPEFIEAIKQDRKALLTADTWRSLIFVLISAAVLYFLGTKPKKENLTIAAIGLLVILDLVLVNQRYVNADDFQAASLVENPYQPSQADQQILQDKSHFRVFDLTSNRTRASYFHNSINGYHAAKMRRFDELFDFHITKNNMEVLNMLNTKYIIGRDEQGGQVVYENPDANGNAWFVNELRFAESADQEIQLLDSVSTKQTAILNKKQFGEYLESVEWENISKDSTSTAELVSYKPNELVYRLSARSDSFLVMSENYYPHGWHSTLNGEDAEHIRVNYVLRGIYIPEGEHELKFSFEPEVVEQGELINLASSILLGLIVLGGLVWTYRQK